MKTISLHKLWQAGLLLFSLWLLFISANTVNARSTFPFGGNTPSEWEEKNYGEWAIIDLNVPETVSRDELPKQKFTLTTKADPDFIFQYHNENTYAKTYLYYVSDNGTQLQIQMELTEQVDHTLTIQSRNNNGWFYFNTNQETGTFKLKGIMTGGVLFGESHVSDIARYQKSLPNNFKNKPLLITAANQTPNTTEKSAPVSTPTTTSPTNYSYNDSFEKEVITNPIDTYFPDTTAGTLEAKASTYLAQKNIIGGRPDGTFDGSASVNRAEAAKFLLLSKGITIDDFQDKDDFPDVKRGEWYARYVLKAAQMGVINGHPTGLFKPGDHVNTAEFLKMITKTFDLPQNLKHPYTDVQASDWYSPYAGVADRYSLFPNRTTKLLPAQKLSRKEVAIAMYQYLSTTQNNTPPSTSTSKDHIINVRKLGSHQQVTKAPGETVKALSLEFKTTGKHDLSSIDIKRINASGNYKDFESIQAVIYNTGNTNGVIGKSIKSELTKITGDTVTLDIDTTIKPNEPVIVDVYVTLSTGAQSGNQSRWVVFLPEWVKSKTTDIKIGFFPFGGHDIYVE